MNISVVIPLFNERESIPELCSWIDKVMQKHGYAYEVIMIDDGSSDSSWKVIEEIAQSNASIKGIKFRRNYGKSAALNEGFKMAEGEVVITMDADLQDSPDEIPDLYKMIKEQGFDLVSGWKKKRYDPIAKTIPSKFFNWVTKIMTGIYIHDFNCGLKAYKKAVVKSIEVYGEMHRYIPVMAKKAGFLKIGEKVVQHQERKYGVSKFGLERFVNGFLDLLSVLFITRFSKRPMHLFGTIGTICFLSGGAVSLWIIVEKLYKLSKHLPVRDVTDQPLFYLGLVAIVVGWQMFLTGFLGELVSRSAADRDTYLIEKRIK